MVAAATNLGLPYAGQVVLTDRNLWSEHHNLSHMRETETYDPDTPKP